MKSVYLYLWSALICLTLLLPNSLRADQITVTVSTDGVPGSLRSAVSTAKAGDTIVFSILLSSVTNTISQGEITIDKNLTIIGDPIVPTLIDASDGSRIFNITGDVTVDMTSLVLSRGAAAANGGAILMSGATLTLTSVSVLASNVTGSAVTHGGGAIANIGGNLTLTNCLFQNNSATGTPSSGGAIINLDGGFITASETTFSNNTAMRAGGAIEDNSGAAGLVTLTNVTIENNETGPSPGNGGGVHITGPGDMVITGGSINGNEASAEGGGLWNGGGIMTVTNVTIDGNTASGDPADQGGGGIFNLSGTVNVSGGVISNNNADGASGSGGGIFNDVGATLNAENTTISGNVSNRAGGGIEDNSGAMGGVTLLNVALNGNTTNTSPGNGGGFHITGPGDATITGGTVNNNNAGAEGGGLWNGAGVMTVTDVTIAGNVASGSGADQGGGGVFNFRGTININGGLISNNVADGAAGSGGGIMNDTLCTLTVVGTEISGNMAMRAGGGIEDNSRESTVVTLDSVTLVNNITGSAPGNGGAVHITGAGEMNITASVVSENLAAAEGGGLWNGSGTMRVSASTIADNQANGTGADQGGGGLFNNGGTLIVTTSTVSGNRATAGGGGITNNGMLEVDFSTIVYNSSSASGGGIFQVAATDSTTLTGTIVVLNTSNDPGSELAGDGDFASGDYNIIESDEEEVLDEESNDTVGDGEGNLGLNLDPELRDNGGATPTHALNCPSIAVDGGPAMDAGPDQRGENTFGDRRDVGAFERQEACTVGIANLAELQGSRVYPNPTGTSPVNVLVPMGYGELKLRLVEASTGRVTLIQTVNAGQTLLSVASLKPGMYILELVGANAYAAHRLVVSR